MKAGLCDACGERPATVWIQIIGADVQQERRLCQRCATEHELDLLPFTLEISPGGEIDISIRQSPPAPAASSRRELPREQCAKCGTTSADVAGTGLVGCARCYDNLPLTIAGLVATVQPGYSSAVDRARSASEELPSLARLQLELAQAVADEQYEYAAALRDKITRMDS